MSSNTTPPTIKRRVGRGLAMSVLGLGVAVSGLFGSMVTGDGFAKADTLTIYSGRGETFVRPVINLFQQQTGIDVQVRYGGTSELAVLLQEEGARSPADLFWGQDAGAMGALANAGLLAELPTSLSDGLPEIFTSRTNQWVATTGRARVLAYSTERVHDHELPDTVLNLVQDSYRGRVGIAPTNGSFQAFVTAMRVELGDDVTLEWLRGLRENDAQVFRNNTTQVIGIAEGEIDFAMVNNYYLPRFTGPDPAYPVAQKFLRSGDLGNMVNVAGIALLASSDQRDLALQFIEFVLSPAAQQYFTLEGNEYPVRQDVVAHPRLDSLENLLADAPVIDLDALADLDGTLSLLREAGWL